MIEFKKAIRSLSAFLSGAIFSIAGILGAAEEASGQDVEAQAERTKFLVLDSRIIDRTAGAELTLGEIEKSKHNPLFSEDKPWETRFDNLNPTVIYDQEEKLYKCWYSFFIIDQSTTDTPREEWWKYTYLGEHTGTKRKGGRAYATSKDGIKWDKPDLGLVEFNGSKQNNLVSRGGAIFRDVRESDPAKRYKGVAKTGSEARGNQRMAVVFSPDGLHWSDPVHCSGIDAEGDRGINNALWVPELGEYVGLTRHWRLLAPEEAEVLWFPGRSSSGLINSGDGIRQVGWTSSKDFLTWTKPKVILEGLEDHLQIYSMPVFRYGGVYIGLPAIFNTKTDRVHTELTWSPDTIKWHRINPGTPFIPNSKNRGDYDWGCVYAGRSAPVIEEEEIRLYYGGSNGLHTSWRDGFFCMATLRPDGFAGYEPTSTDTPAIITTKPVLGQFAALRITADVQVGGSVRVAVVDKQGKELARSEPLNSTVTDGKITWEAGWDVNAMSGEKIRLKFELNDAKLYAFSFK